MAEHDLKDFMNRITVYPHSSLSEDGSHMAFISNLTGHPQVWVGEISPLVGKMLFPKHVTSSLEKSPHVMTPALKWIGNERLVITYEQHGDENTRIEILNLRTNESVEVPRGKGRDFLSFVSHAKIYFSSNRADPKTQGLYIFDIKTNKVSDMYSAPGRWTTWDETKAWKGSQFFVETLSNTSNQLKAIHLKTKEITDIFTEPDTLTGAVGLLPGDKLLVTSNFKRQFSSLAILDLKTRQLDFLQKDKWDIELTKLSRDQKFLFVARNVEGQSHLEQYTFPGLKPVPIKFKSGGVLTSIDYAEKQKALILGFMSPTEPKNFYRLSLKTKKIDRLTDTWTSCVSERELSAPKSIRYESDGKQIHSWLFLPSAVKRDGKTPVIIWPHGGPQWQERAQFRPIFQYFVSRGFALWAPNPRGSTGYGIDFTNEINGQWGTADFPDMLNGIAWLKQSGWIDPKKICIMGGSYGGYMTLRCITKIPHTFRAAVDIFGVSNLLTFVETVPDDWKFFMDKFVGNPQHDRAKLLEQSPITSLDKVDCPLLVIQGGRDPRVVKAESDQVIEKMKQMKKDVEYLVFDDEGHGFLKPHNELAAYRAAADFIERHINAANHQSQ